MTDRPNAALPGDRLMERMEKKAPRLVIKKSTREAWLDGRKLDLTDETFAALLVLAESRVAGEPYVTPEDLEKRVAALLEVG